MQDSKLSTPLPHGEGQGGGSDISPRAEISPKAKIGKNCKVFPFVYIEDDVVIGDNCIIFPFVSILDGTRLGSHNKVHLMPSGCRKSFCNRPASARAP